MFSRNETKTDAKFDIKSDNQDLQKHYISQ